MMGLLALVREHREAVEADLLRWYRVDLARDLGTERLTYRRLWGLIEALPRESTLMQALGGDGLRWGTTEHLLAQVVDSLNWQTHALLQSRSKRKLKPPQPMKRPTDPKPIGAGGGMTPEELRAKLARPRIDKRGKGGAVG